MKKTVYILCFTFLGFLVAVLVDGLFQLYLENYTVAYSAKDLADIHSFVQLILVAGCSIWGYKAGRYWWHQLYELKKYRNRWFRKYKWA